MDEIGELPQTAQVKLLRVLQEREVRRIGGAKKTYKVNVRIIAATHRDLEKMIQQGEFRSDLYYRLNVVPIMIPPLRDRPEDIPALIDHFLMRIRENSNKTIQLARTAFDRLTAYDWPGNIRELENAIQHARVMCEEDIIQVTDLPVVIQITLPDPLGNQKPGENSHHIDNQLTLDEIEKKALIDALNAVNYNHTRAAQRLCITRRMLGSRLDKYNLPRKITDRVVESISIPDSRLKDKS